MTKKLNSAEVFSLSNVEAKHKRLTEQLNAHRPCKADDCELCEYLEPMIVNLGIQRAKLMGWI